MQEGQERGVVAAGATSGVKRAWTRKISLLVTARAVVVDVVLGVDEGGRGG